ncbi:MAG: hypothetical protein Q8868_13565 [Bacteroidota bacterium]|nr:hypothetical protein [Bacteroidota bacterium]
MMKKVALAGMVVISVVTACEKPVEQSDHEVFFKIGEYHAFRFDDISLYDSSTHILYFREAQNLFGEFLQERFTFLDSGDTIYSGTFNPGYSSSLPVGPFIPSPSMYGDHALRIELWFGNMPDERNSPRLIEILKNHDLLHSGLSGEVDLVEVNTSALSFGFTITNHDLTDLLIIDINKTGPELFHYFTNGLYLRDPDHNEVFSSTIQHQTPEPWNSWKPEWLSVLKSGESKSFTITYPLETSLSPGEYRLLFEFPGLAYQVSKDELFQGNERIWLGDITLRKIITIP